MDGISVIVCTFNGEKRLDSTLKHLLNQKCNIQWELVIVDNASTDATSEFCKKVLESVNLSFKWRILHEDQKGLIYARMRGLREALYDVVLYCDDDNSLHENYVQLGHELMKRNVKIGALGGFGIPVFEGNKKPIWFDRYSHSFAVGQQSSHDGKLIEFPAELYGAGTFLRKEALLNFFDRGFMTIMTGRIGSQLVSGDDVEWCFLVQLAGYEIWYDHRLTFEHTMPASRMQWNYYLKLKQGIASGSASLLPYTCLFKNRKMALICFCLYWFSNLLKFNLMFLRHRFKLSWLPKPIAPETELAIIVLRAKAMSYWRSGVKPFQHFIHLRKLL